MELNVHNVIYDSFYKIKISSSKSFRKIREYLSHSECSFSFEYIIKFDDEPLAYIKKDSYMEFITRFKLTPLLVETSETSEEIVEESETIEISESSKFCLWD